ncbi:MAG: hypothetical protein V7L25_32195 [Nostoc sp.]
MVLDLHKQADMLELSVAAGEIDLVPQGKSQKYYCAFAYFES